LLNFLANGLWNSNAGIGESLYKLGHFSDCIGPIKESVALLEAEKRNIDLEISRLKQFLRRATRKTGSGYCGESDSSAATVATSIQPPRILNTLQVYFIKLYIAHAKPTFWKNNENYMKVV